MCLRRGTWSSCPGPSLKFLPIASSLGRTGKDQVEFGSAEPHTVLFHEPGSDSVWVGGRGKVYLFNFPEGKNASVHTVSLGPPLPLAPISLLISPLALVREPQGIQGRELAFLPKLVHPPLYLINGPWGMLPNGSPDRHGCWAVWSKAWNLPAWPGG